MSPNDAEALRRAARSHIGRQVLPGNVSIDDKLFEFVGIRMRIFHYDPKQPNPVEFWNIESENDFNITIPVMIQDLVSGESTISLDAIVRPVDGTDMEYQYHQLEPFLYRIAHQ